MILLYYKANKRLFVREGGLWPPPPFMLMWQCMCFMVCLYVGYIGSLHMCYCYLFSCHEFGCIRNTVIRAYKYIINKYIYNIYIYVVLISYCIVGSVSSMPLKDCRAGHRHQGYEQHGRGDMFLFMFWILSFGGLVVRPG